MAPTTRNSSSSPSSSIALSSIRGKVLDKVIIPRVSPSYLSTFTPSTSITIEPIQRQRQRQAPRTPNRVSLQDLYNLILSLDNKVALLQNQLLTSTLEVQPQIPLNSSPIDAPKPIAIGSIQQEIEQLC